MHAYGSQQMALHMLLVWMHIEQCYMNVTDGQLTKLQDIKCEVRRCGSNSSWRGCCT